MTVAIRPAEGDDAAAIARVQVATWRTAYAGIFPDAYLDHLNDIRIAAGWTASIERPGHVTLVAEDGSLPREPVVGFAHAGPGEAAGEAEIFTLYVLATHQRRGLGRRLLAAMARRLAPVHARLVIRVLVENGPARAFYERLGGSAGDIRRLHVGGRPVDEIAYHWPDLPRLSATLAGAAP
ncbi:N-acetyltransferase family protein [Stella sp.]|uniref:GNAT family N-acetyltransferase n=1 Tax=Stella sp. TaxID=2912054 RepID=UPI0035B3B8E9